MFEAGRRTLRYSWRSKREREREGATGGIDGNGVGGGVGDPE